uniref:G_PROTEIN_RECEP_F1_2 domain-containing protein n=2 Tax=Caenorhabditis tropicalis TaxID=1561998 RepID=A0A1I7V3Y7_9PELO
MRTASIYVLLIGVCLSELYSMIIPLKLKFEQFWVTWQKCPVPPSVLQIYFNRIVISTADNTTRLSTWLCVLFALVRVTVFQKMSDNRFQMISAPGFGWILCFMSFVGSFVISLSFYFKDQIEEVGLWTPQPGCESLSTSEIYQYKLVPSDLYTFGNGIFAFLFFLSNGFFSHLLPCILYPLLIAFLLKEIRKPKRIQSGSTINPHQKRNQKTTILVTVVSVFEFLIQMGFSTIFVLELVLGRDTLDSLKFAKIGMRWVFAFNSSIRCFLCVAFSCRYRNTIRRMFGFRDRTPLTGSHKTNSARPSPSLQRSASSILPPCSPKAESSL